MIDTNKQYQTRCGYPVRNLRKVLFVYEGEYYYKNEWHLGGWICDGKPDIFTSDRELIDSLTLIEKTDPIAIKPNGRQLNIFF